MVVLSSVSEGLPMSLLEAMAAGLPAVVTDVGGMAEVMRGCDTGMAAAPRDPEALAEALVRMVGSPDRARACYPERLTLEAMAESFWIISEAVQRISP